MASLIEEIVQHPLGHLRSLSQRCRDVWKIAEQARLHRDDFGVCPNWCFLPIRALEKVLLPNRELHRTILFRIGVYDLLGLSAWRASQGVYLFDQDAFDAIWSTSIQGEIPVAVLERLPEWCCYIAFPDMRTIVEIKAHGFFVWLNYDPTNGQRELHFLIEDGKSMDHQQPSMGGWWVLPLSGTLEDSIGAGLAKHADGSEKWESVVGSRNSKNMHQFLVDHYHDIAPLICLTLYLCSAEPDVQGREKFQPPYHPQATATRHGPKLFPPDKPKVWEVGYRIGTTLRLAKESSLKTDSPRDESASGIHASPRPHLRRAHWHTFWIGPKTKAQEACVRWLHPILVNDDGRGIVPTVHRVKN
jgi:hypothetical protein